MLTILTSEGNNDIFLTPQGDIALGSGKEAVANVCRNALLTIQGELKYNTSQGVPYWNILKSGKADLDALRFYIIKTVQNMKGVKSIKSLNFNTNTDEISYTLIINTDEGEAVING